MNTATCSPPPALATITGSGVVAVHVGHKHGPLPAPIWPKGDFLGGLLAAHLVRTILEDAGLLAPGAGCGSQGPLDDCVMLAEVTSVAEAVDLLRTKLTASPLNGYFTIAVTKEDGWVEVHPQTGAPATWLMDTDRHEAATRDLFADLRRQTEDRLQTARALLEIAAPEARPIVAETIAGLEKLLHQLAQHTALESPE